MTNLDQEIARRRTFAIISHPDAGKTTLTEKLLLYGGAIQMAGSVKARRSQRKATSDWMEIEKQRGISITSTVLQFQYKDHVLNLLDTPGHDDFSADTYRTLTAADSAVMLIDNASGVEAQTKKLFAVCRQREIPIFTFVNKLDNEGPGPLAVLADIEESLGIRGVPITWPVGQGMDFKGILDRREGVVHLFEKTQGGARVAETKTMLLSDPGLEAVIGTRIYNQLKEESELLDIAGEAFDLDQVLAGQLTPVFFGSALTNFGVSVFLDAFLEMAPSPGARADTLAKGKSAEALSGFVFKIQANMDPLHRDRIAYMRIVTGEFNKDVEVVNQRSGKTLRLTRPQRLFAQEREIVDEAYPGDIVGLPNPGAFMLGDTLTTDSTIRFDEVPEFVPETFGRLINRSVSRFKHFEKGITQLVQEGLTQLFWDSRSQTREPVLGVIGKLQFDVIQYRLQSEYGVDTAVEVLPYEIIRWIDGDRAAINKVYWGDNTMRLEDQAGNPVILTQTAWTIGYLERQNPTLKFLPVPSAAFTALAN